MKIGMILVRHPATRVSPILPEVVRLLTDWGVDVDEIYPEEQLTDLRRVRAQHDLYVLKSGTELALSFAGALHVAGAKIINPYPVSEMLRDKIVTTRILQMAQVPQPETYVTARPRNLAGLLVDGSLVVKPYRGSQGRGVRVIRTLDELNTLPDDGPLFAQRCVEPDGRDRKLYVIGGQVFGVKRVWPVRSYDDKLGEPFTITPELHDIALRCCQAFGIDLAGIDIVESDGRPYVVDMSSFPGFKGVPDAALRLADYIYTAAESAVSGDVLLPARLQEWVA